MAVAARIYAKALFDAAKAAGCLPQAREELGDLVAALGESHDLRNLLHNPQIDARAKKAGLDAVFADADAVFRNFLRTVADKGRLREIEEMHGELERLVADEERVLSVELTTAVELSAAAAGGVAGPLGRAGGRRVAGGRSGAPARVGGIVLRAGSFRVDGSVRGRLDSLRQELTTK